MEITLLKDYTSGYGRLFLEGSTIDCDRTTYEKLLADKGCKELGKAKAKKKAKVKPVIKPEKNGIDR
tara:strand:- start:218 stop:418 length:201 start_codon:yes stop_codon:yes gene_type:complete